MTASSQALTVNTLNPQTANISYQFDFARFLEHLVDVSLTFTADTDAPSLWLPAWIPGSYLMREFARNITAVHYQIMDDERSEVYRAIKTDKNTWQLPHVKAGQVVDVSYEVYCYDLSVRTAYVDQQRLYGNFTSLALAIEGQEQKAIEVDLSVPAADNKLTLNLGIQNPLQKYLTFRSTTKGEGFEHIDKNSFAGRAITNGITYNFGQMRSKVVKTRRTIHNDDLAPKQEQGGGSLPMQK